MAFSSSYGFQNLLKEGHKHLSGLEEALMKNINACKEISKITKTSLGPNGMKKMVINHLDKIFVTSDAATIMKELEVQHPAAKLIVMAAKMQENECGDGTNFVISFAGELLSQAESLLKMGLHPSQIVSGFEQACKKSCELLQQLVCFEVSKFTDEELVSRALKSSLSSKLGSYTDHFTKLVSKACIQSVPENKFDFDIDFVRTAKILGASVEKSFVMQGMVITRSAEGSVVSVKNPKVVVYSTPLDPQQQETKGTVLIKNADDLLNYNKSEEILCEKLVKGIADAGVKLVCAGGSISEMVQHYFEKYQIMVVKIQSKFDIKRICKALGATPVARIDPPTPEEMGDCDECCVEEIGSQKVTIFKRNSKDCKLSTIILRGSNNNLLEDLERSIDDAVNVYRCLLREPRFVPGAGATESILSSKLAQEAKTLEELNQYSYNRFAQAFEIIPRILSDNAGLNSNEIIPKLITENLKEPHGIAVWDQGIQKSSDLSIYDHMQTKEWAIKLATDAAITVLKVDQIIIAKPAGGPKPPSKNADWDQD